MAIEKFRSPLVFSVTHYSTTTQVKMGLSGKERDNYGGLLIMVSCLLLSLNIIGDLTILCIKYHVFLKMVLPKKLY